MRDRGEPSDAPRIEAGLAALREGLKSESVAMVGHTLEGLQRAGFADEAYGELEKRLYAEDLEETEALKLLSAAPRLQTLEGVDPFLVAWSVDVALRAADTALEEAAGDSSIARTVSEAASHYRSAISFASQVAPGATLEYLLTSMQEMERVELLGMDAVSNLRTELENYRLVAEEQDAALIDSTFLRILMDAGERLFLVQEEPMTEAEHDRFFRARDSRYNAAYYFDHLWQKAPGLPGTLAAQPDVVDYLLSLALADEEEILGEGADTLYLAVEEKTETRLLAANLLARLEHEFDVDPPIDLYDFFLEALGDEVQATPEDVLACRRDLADAATEQDPVCLEIVHEPGDEWIKDRCIQALRDLGYRVTDRDQQVCISRQTREMAP
jgi:hypothetical protein